MKKKKILGNSIFICLCLFCTLFVSASADTAQDGMKLDAEGKYFTASTDMAMPLTCEATLCLPSDLDDRGGVIFGSYSTSETPCFNFEVYTNGNPRVYIINENIAKYNLVFDEVDLRTGEPVHVAITLDRKSGVGRCYINGVLAQTVEKKPVSVFTLNTTFCLGGDNRDGNAQYFKGELYSLALYSDIRSDAEIALDAAGDLATEELVAAYELSGNEEKNITAIGNEKYNITYHSDWIKNLSEPESYAYSFAVIGDIQTLNYLYPDKLINMFEWIRDNKEEKKIAFSIGLGDVTEKNTESEYLKAIEAYGKIDGTVPFSIVRGNHDRKVYSSAMYDTYITQEKYGDEITGSYDSTMLNTYRIIKIGKVKYMFMNLDYVLSDKVLEWANGIIAANPECHVIVSTHIYMSQTGSYYTVEGDSGIGKKYGAENNGEALWDKVLSQHENVVMLICGHNPTDDIYYRQREGVNGNKVTEILIDPQGTDKNRGGVGLVAMFYFSEDGEHIDVQYYSTDKDAYFKANNQFSLDLDTSGVIEDDGDTDDGGNTDNEDNTDNEGNTDNGSNTDNEGSTDGDSSTEEDDFDGEGERVGFFAAIAKFFAKIAEWFKSIFKKS